MHGRVCVCVEAVKVVPTPVKVNSAESAAGRRLVILLAEQGELRGSGCGWGGGVHSHSLSAPLPCHPSPLPPPPPSSSSSVPRQRCQASPSRNREAIWCLFGTLSPGRVQCVLLYVDRFCDSSPNVSRAKKKKKTRKNVKITGEGAEN